MARKAKWVCRECGEPLTGQKQRWCGPACASKVYARARRLAFDAYCPPNTHCQHCNAPVAAGVWFCDPACRAEYRAAYGALPSRYDRREFFKR